MDAVVLTMIIVFYGSGNPTTTATVKHEYPNATMCESAKKTNADALKQGEVVMATCTKA